MFETVAEYQQAVEEYQQATADACETREDLILALAKVINKKARDGDVKGAAMWLYLLSCRFKNSNEGYYEADALWAVCNKKVRKAYDALPAVPYSSLYGLLPDKQGAATRVVRVEHEEHDADAVLVACRACAREAAAIQLPLLWQQMQEKKVVTA